MTTNELDQLLRDRFDLGREDLIAALKALPAHRPWAATLTASEARLLDDAGLTENPEAYTQILTAAAIRIARLYSTAYTAAEVAIGLGVNDSQIRQRRLDHTLWAIDSGGSWIYPVVQFELLDTNRGVAPLTLRDIHGLDQVLPQLLTRGLHPAAIAGFLLATQPELLIDGQPKSVREWLLRGEPTEPVLNLVEIGEWSST